MMYAVHATAMAWEAAGRPRRASLPASPAPGRCAVCGTEAGETVPAKATIGNSTFADHDRLADPHAKQTCYPCAWAMSGRPPDAVRMWSLACAPGRDFGPSHPDSVKAVTGEHPGLFLGNRKDLRPLAALLCSPPDGPWLATMTETGQKHCLPWTPVNHGAARWHVRMDGTGARAFPGEFAGVRA